MPRKILLSPSLVWSTQASTPAERDFMLTYAPFIEAVESCPPNVRLDRYLGLIMAHEQPTDDDRWARPGSPLDLFYREWERRFPAPPYPCYTTLNDLCVVEVEDRPFRIETLTNMGPEKVKYACECRCTCQWIDLQRCD